MTLTLSPLTLREARAYVAVHHRLIPSVEAVLAVAAADRFWPKVEKSDGCWLWIASRNIHGYGQLRLGGRSGRPVGAHRIGYILANGAIEPGLDVLHRCDNPPCVRPDHLRLGTAAQNLRDAATKGRLPLGPRGNAPIGERNGHARLTTAAVRDIRARYQIRSATPTELAEEFGVSPSTVWRVIYGTTWGHV